MIGAIKNKILIMLILSINYTSLVNAQVLGGYLELHRNVNSIKADVRLLFNLPLPTINYLKIDWGDGSPLDSLPLKNNSVSGQILGQKYYSGNHTYMPGATYTVIAGDLFLAQGFNNIPNSSTKKLALICVINFHVFANPPISPFLTYLDDSVSCIYSHYDDYNSNASMSSPDGDSLAYSMNLHPEIQGYIPPPVGVHPITGNVTFTSNASGNYNFSTKTDSWRRSVVNGPFDMLTGTTYREIYLSVCNISIPSTTKVDEMGDDYIAEFSLYPNPVSDKLHLTNKDSSQEVKAFVMNVLGETLFETGIFSEKGQIDFTNYPSGVYYIKMESKTSSIVYKIIKE